MFTDQRKYSTEGGWQATFQSEGFDNSKASLVLAFGAKNLLTEETTQQELRNQYPAANTIRCSTAGEIAGVRVEDHSVVSTAIHFKKTEVQTILKNVADCSSSLELGKMLSQGLKRDDLNHVLLISDGQIVNGSELLKGVNEVLDKSVTVTGGMAGDDDNFSETLVGLDEDIRPGNVVAVGFYGNALQVSYGTHGGWDEFGPYRQVTKSEGNVLYELDDKNALDLYKKYLGPKAAELPGSALLFPLSMRETPESKPLVRTILSVNEKDKTMTFAGDIPVNSTVRLMKANFDRLIYGASKAAEDAVSDQQAKPQLVLLISCVGRKLVLDQRVEEEIEVIEEILGDKAVYCGFYSYGELSPNVKGEKCDLHNQTMTLTTYSEI